MPVYQRQYRWEIEECEQLLADIRAVAHGHTRQTHFLGSILYTTSPHGDITERMLVDGQQRIATLMLLATALRDTLGKSDHAIFSKLQDVLLHPVASELTRLRLRSEGERELDGIIFGHTPADAGVGITHLRNNYDFFVREIVNDARPVWDGLQKLEHVAITIRENASPQQVFESLNSTGAPLRNHELIHTSNVLAL